MNVHCLDVHHSMIHELHRILQNTFSRIYVLTFRPYVTEGVYCVYVARGHDAQPLMHVNLREALDCSILHDRREAFSARLCPRCAREVEGSAEGERPTQRKRAVQVRGGQREDERDRARHAPAPGTPARLRRHRPPRPSCLANGTCFERARQRSRRWGLGCRRVSGDSDAVCFE